MDVVDGKVYLVDVYYLNIYGDGSLVTRVEGECIQQFVSQVSRNKHYFSEL